MTDGYYPLSIITRIETEALSLIELLGKLAIIPFPL